MRAVRSTLIASRKGARTRLSWSETTTRPCFAPGAAANLIGTASVLAAVTLAPPAWATGLVLASGLPTLLRASDVDLLDQGGTPVREGTVGGAGPCARVVIPAT